MQEYLDWPYLPLPPELNVNSHLYQYFLYYNARGELLTCGNASIRNYTNTIDPETMKNITEANRYDLQLYEIAKRRFQQHIDAVGRDYFEGEVRTMPYHCSISSIF